MSDPGEVVRAYWACIQARDWDGLRDVLAPDVVVEWTATGECFVGPDNVVGVNAAYPEGWSIRVRSVVAEGDRVASDVEVPMDGVGVFRVAAFVRVEGGRITSSTEYWIGVGSELPPPWRSAWSRAGGRTE